MMQPRDDRREIAQPQSRDAPHLPACSHPLPERTTPNTITCIYNMFPDPATEKLPQNVSPTVDNKQPHGTSHTGDPSDKRPQAARRPCALPQPKSDRRRTPPTTLIPAQASGHEGTNRKGKRDSMERPEDGGTARYTHYPTLAGKLHPSPKTANLIECTPKTVAPKGLAAPSHVCLCWATTGNQCELPSLPRSQREGGVRLPNVAPTPFPNHHAPWQLLAERGYGAHQAAPEPLAPGTREASPHTILRCHP